MKARVKFFYEKNGERYYFAYNSFLPCEFNFSTKATITRGYRRVIQKCRRTLYMNFGAITMKSECFMLQDGKEFGPPIASAKFELYF